MAEIGKVVLEIQKAEFGNFTVPVNNTLVCLASSFVFLAADTLLCVLIIFVPLAVIIKALTSASLLVGADQLVNSSAIKSNLQVLHETH